MRRSRTAAGAIWWLLDKLDDGNRSAFSRQVSVSVHSPSRWTRSGTIRLDSLLQLCGRLGLWPVDLLLRSRGIRFGPVEVEDFPRRRRSAIDWLQVERELDALFEGSEAMSLLDAARMLGVRANSLWKRLPAKVEKLRQRAQ